MHDSEENYPLHQPQDRQDRAEKGPQRPFDDKDEAGLEKRPVAPQQSVGPVHQRERATTPELPPHRFRNALIVGAISGFFCVAQSIAITLWNAPTYHAFEIAKDAAVKSALAFTTYSFAVLTFFISLLIFCVAGFITGKISVQRRFGFLAGFLAGLIVYASSFITNIIPNYPGALHTSTTTAGSGAATGGLFVYLLPLIFLLMWGIIGGLVSLLGAWLATRKHPYYVGY